MAVYAASDWHGHFWIWEKVKNILQPEDRLYFLGDAADRGPDGWFLIKALLNDFRVTYIKGNHDQMLCDRHFRNTSYDVEDIHNYNGGRHTWRQFLIDTDPHKESYITKLDHCSYFATYLNKNHQNVFMSHSGSINTRENYQLIWDRSHFYNPNIKPYDLVVHGHTPNLILMEELIGEFPDTDEDITSKATFYCDGKKCDIDAGTHFTNQAYLFNLNTFESELITND